MIDLNLKPDPGFLSEKLMEFWDLSGRKINLIDKYYDESQGFTCFYNRRKVYHKGMD